MAAPDRPPSPAKLETRKARNPPTGLQQDGSFSRPRKRRIFRSRSRCLSRSVVLLDAHGHVRLVGIGGALRGASYETVGQQGCALDVGDERYAEVDRGTSDEVPGADLLRLLGTLFRAAHKILVSGGGGGQSAFKRSEIVTLGENAQSVPEEHVAV